jgi:hypothetical protein
VFLCLTQRNQKHKKFFVFLLLVFVWLRAIYYLFSRLKPHQYKNQMDIHDCLLNSIYSYTNNLFEKQRPIFFFNSCIFVSLALWNNIYKMKLKLIIFNLRWIYLKKKFKWIFSRLRTKVELNFHLHIALLLALCSFFFKYTWVLIVY